MPLILENNPSIRNNKIDFAQSSVFEETFHSAIGPIIFWAQFFGVMPVSGTRSTNPNNLKFRWLAKRNIGTMAFLFFDALIMILYVKYFSKVGMNLGNMVSMMFFSMSFLAYFSFLLLAIKWPRFMYNWTKMEMRFLKSPYIVEKFKLKNQIKNTALVIAGLAIGEHIMFQISILYGFFIRLDECNIDVPDRIKYYYVGGYPHIFDGTIPYHLSVCLILQLMSVTSTFVWNFMDLFIILVSIGVNIRFRQIHALLLDRENYNERQRKSSSLSVSSNQHQDNFFHQIRMDFIQICDLLAYVDGEMSFIILVSCINNLYFICYQLMNIFQTLRYPINYAYFWFSMGYLLGRTIYLFLSAAKINDSAKLPISLLRNIKSDEWGEDSERLLYKMCNETIALSGMGFFHFTKKLILAMVGTIVTFELVILQFSWDSTSKELPPLCD